jgi:hypothetical protein
MKSYVEILDLDPKIRFAGVSDDTGETKYGGQREGVKNLLSSEETVEITSTFMILTIGS